MRSSKYLIAGGAIKWDEKLAEYYAERDAAEQKSLQQWQQHRSEKVKVAGEESITKVFSQLAQFSSSAMQLKQAIDAKNAKAELEADQKDFKALQLNPIFRENADEILEINDYEYKKQKGQKITEQETEKYKKTVAYLEAKDREATHEVLNMSGRRLINRNETLANYASSRLDEQSMFADWSANPRDYPNAYSNYRKASGPSKKGIYENWMLKKLAHLDLNDTAKVALLGGELVRRSNTRSNLNKAGATRRIVRAETEAHRTTIETAFKAGNGIDGIFNVRGELDQNPKFKDQLDSNGNVILTRNKVIDAHLEGILAESLISGNLPVDVVSAYLKTGIKHRSAKGDIKVGDILFSPEQVNNLVAAGKIGQGRIVALTTQDHVGRVGQALALKLQGKTAEAAAMMKPVYAAGLVPKETITAYENSKPEANTPEAYQTKKRQYDIAVGNGFVNVTQDVIDAEDNKEIKDLYQDTFDKLQRHNETAGDGKGSLASTVWKSFNGDVIFPTNNFDQTTSGQITAELDRKAAPLKLERILKQYETGVFKADHTINEVVHTFKEGLWARGGGGVKGGTGVYSGDAITGSPDNWKEANGFKRRAVDGHQLEGTVARKQQWTAEINNKTLGRATADIEKLIDNGEVFSDADLVATRETGNFSDRMYHIADVLNKDVGELYLRTIEHRKNNAPEFAAKYGFRKLTNEDLKLEGSGDLAQAKLRARDIVIKNFEGLVEKMEEQINSQTAEWTTDMPVGTQGNTNINSAFNSNRIYQVKDLIRKLKTRRWAQLTNNEQQRIINTMSLIGPSATYKAEP